MADTSSLDPTTDHAVLVTGKWDWTISSVPGRWTTAQEGIKPRRYFIPTSATTPRKDGFGVLKSRLKIRGKGESLVIRYESKTGKDFQILGWTIPFKAETQD